MAHVHIGWAPDGGFRISFRFHDGTLLATVQNGRLTTGPVDGDVSAFQSLLACLS
ncbi:hypothetical protein [Parafrankia soli]|uniref:hypothetical protein n=1 Tax=Parafrankia soli TaxID=2599596 RepID=UPI001F517F94|nr:hypothetical protein [Parafrankia soli]